MHITRAGRPTAAHGGACASHHHQANVKRYCCELTLVVRRRCRCSCRDLVVVDVAAAERSDCAAHAVDDSWRPIVERLARDSVACTRRSAMQCSKEGATSLSEPMMDKHRWGGRVIAGSTLGSGCCCGWLYYVYVYMPAKPKSIDIVSPRPLIRTRRTIPHYYLHPRSRRSTLSGTLLSSPLHSRYVVSCRLVTSPSPFPRSDLPITR